MPIKLIISTALFVAASIMSATILANSKPVNSGPNSQNADYVLFYGSACPHCKIVEDYLALNNASGKLNIAQKEVSADTTNLELMRQKAAICNLDANNLVVPMLWDGKTQRCFVGDQPIIEFIGQELGKTGQQPSL